MQGPWVTAGFDIKLGAEAGRSGYLLNSARGTLGASCEVENCWCPGELSWLWGQAALVPVVIQQSQQARALRYFVFGLGGDSLSARGCSKEGREGEAGFLPFQALQGASGMLSQPLAMDLTRGTWDCQQQWLTAAFPL